MQMHDAYSGGSSIFQRREGMCGHTASAIVPAQKRLRLDSRIRFLDDSSEDDASLRLTLSPPGQHNFHEVQPAPPAPAQLVQAGSSAEAEPDKSKPKRRLVDRPIVKRKDDKIPPPYEWATDKRGVVRTVERLNQCGRVTILGGVVCKKCDGTEEREIELRASFLQLDKFFMDNRDSLHDRAPKRWLDPRLMDCKLCHQSDCVKPVINQKKRHINWLFLVLTQTLGQCTLDQLKYFCKHTHKHRTGAKDRVLYLTYVGLLQQMNPGGCYEYE